MPNIPIILAQGDDGGDWIKFVFGGIVFLFWIISAMATWLNKRHEEQRRRRLREQLDRESIEAARGQSRAPAPAHPPRIDYRPTPMPTAPVRVPPPRTVSQPRPQPPPRVPPQRPKPPRQPRSRGIAPPPVPARPAAGAVSAEARTEAATLPVSATEISTGATPQRARAAAADAASIARWLQPGTLRHQFILTEILQPPVALRERTD